MFAFMAYYLVKHRYTFTLAVLILVYALQYHFTNTFCVVVYRGHISVREGYKITSVRK